MSQNNEVKHYFSGLALYEYFINRSGASTKDIAMVESHIDYAMPLLNEYTKAFPKYTLHNNFHQKNIVKIIGDLLGPEIEKLDALECAMLLLATVYHDIGMVFNTDEIDNILSEPQFETFLEENTSAMLEFEDNNRQGTPGLIEWYCRWMHAKRVWKYLNKIHAKIPLMWENISIKTNLGYLCESHNWGIEKIISNLSDFSSEYLGKCDLAFCAILLRLADVLDFDNTRSPLSVYEFLDLENPKNNLDTISKIEWQKHLTSNGFKFIREENTLRAIFSATPKHPNIEVAIKNFIRYIDYELNACIKLQKFCSKRWQNVPLPLEIDTKNLAPENYQSGDYHFSLAEEKILDLLTGEGLYENEFIFIRELLQNAIDTSRHREFIESQKNLSYKADPIRVSFFTDSIGYQWIRIDDFGMGMNEDIIRNHLLKKGESYYNSDKFKLDKIKINKKLDKDFVPISRFGIGLLSCFMAGDRIEISTKHHSSSGNAFRLGIEGRNGHYVLQSQAKYHDPLPMPSKFEEDEGYRNEPGTSISVRITTNKEFLGFDLKRQLEEFVLCSPIPIKLDNEVIGGSFEDLINKPWAENETISIEPSLVNKVESKLGLKFSKGIDIIIENINITERSLNPNLKGQILLFAVNCEYERSDGESNVGFNLSIDNSKFSLRIYKTIKDKDDKETIIEETLDINYIIAKFNLPVKKLKYPFTDEVVNFYEKIQLSHNGIILNDHQGKFLLNNDYINRKFSVNGHNNFSFFYSGILYFQDGLLPDVTVSRSQIKKVSFGLTAYLSFALEPLNKYMDSEYNYYHFFKEQTRPYDFTSGDIIKSRIYEDNTKFLDNHITIHLKSGDLKIAQLKEGVIEGEELIFNGFYSTFYSILTYYVIEQNFDIKVTFNEDGSTRSFLLSTRHSPFYKLLQQFRPITFVNFEENDQRLFANQKININHAFMRWYLKAAPLLQAEYHYYSIQLINSLYYTSQKEGLENCKRILSRLDSVLPKALKPGLIFSLNIKDFD
ncbi:HD domain-containing protein [Sphingobacterium siyangense]|uniref:HD domain-containing protein n=1 Tax=Sphingobacterium siyangense TaxID=459529 RepID=UPI0028AE837B|nr:hypothetical protein [Sphingobacterium siyangense]